MYITNNTLPTGGILLILLTLPCVIVCSSATSESLRKTREEQRKATHNEGMVRKLIWMHDQIISDYLVKLITYHSLSNN